MAFCCAVEPSAVSDFLPPQAAWPAAAPEPAGAPPRLSLLPHAVKNPPPSSTAVVTAARRLPTLSSLTGLASSTHPDRRRPFLPFPRPPFTCAFGHLTDARAASAA